MKTIQVSRRAKTVNELLDKARDEAVIVQAADGAEFRLSMIEDFDKEIAATRNNKKLMDLLDSRACQTEWIPLEQVERDLDLSEATARQKKPKRKNHKKK